MDYHFPGPHMIAIKTSPRTGGGVNWAVDMFDGHPNGGTGFAPLDKWDLFASTESQALIDAVEYIRELRPDMTRRMHLWLESLAPRQPDLFG